MLRRILPLCLIAVISGCASLPATKIANATNHTANYISTNDHYRRLINGTQPQMAELMLFFSMMPKGGDIHHHYSGAIYAETYLDWVDKQGFCIYKSSLKIESDKNRIAAEQGKDPSSRDCVSASAIEQDNPLYRELLQRWSDKDYANHTRLQPPPDTQFFDTFNYFGPASSYNYNAGLQLLKKQALQENVQYIETMLKSAPQIAQPDAEFDTKIAGLDVTKNQAALMQIFNRFTQQFDADPSVQQKITQYIDTIVQSSANIDDAQFAMRYQAYVSRNNPPSQLFSGLYTAFAAAARSKLIVGINIVGPENGIVAMRDYDLHMQMFQFFKHQFPDVRLALHAGELALGMVPPEGLTYHINAAVHIAGADRIGHGVDIAHETNAAHLLKTMRDKNIAVEINLTSNEFILGIKDSMHPVTLSTDDAGVSRNNLSSQYVLFAARYKPSYDEIKKVVFNSIHYSFLSKEDKQKCLQGLETKFSEFEAAIAGLDNRNLN
jgi:adenosine deaminase